MASIDERFVRMNSYQQLRGYLNQIGKEFNTYSGAKLNAIDGMDRVQEELDEAYEEAGFEGMQISRPTTDKFVIECADVILTLASVCAGLGLNLDEAIAQKHMKNMKRTWEPHPTILGGVQHKKESK